MADIGASIITYLKTKSAITSLVGAGNDSRIYLDYPKQGVALPYIVLEVFEGTSAENIATISGIANNRIQISAYAASAAACYSLAELIRLAPLQMYRGMMGTLFCNGVTSDNSYRRGYDPASAGANDERFWIARDYFFDYVEATS
jgi:hypothetical protein